MVLFWSDVLGQVKFFACPVDHHLTPTSLHTQPHIDGCNTCFLIMAWLSTVCSSCHLQKHNCTRIQNMTVTFLLFPTLIIMNMYIIKMQVSPRTHDYCRILVMSKLWSIICDPLSKNQPSSYLVVFWEILFWNIQPTWALYCACVLSSKIRSYLHSYLLVFIIIIANNLHLWWLNFMVFLLSFSAISK